ncbi:MAG: sulfite exporter TauE/SafE family protein, partial [Candidatus Neomarinimicrobiota bacterium]
MIQDLSAVFLIGLFSSFSHCYGMCGGFVVAYSVRMPAGSSVPAFRSWLPHLLYNGGRILTYTFLGAWFGLFGASLRILLHDYQAVVFLAAGVVMVLVGLDFAGWISVSMGKLPGYRSYIGWVRNLIQVVNYRNLFLYGLVLGFLPCGLVAIAAAQAAATGDPLLGMATMAVFGLGTMPAMTLLGFTAQKLSA